MALYTICLQPFLTMLQQRLPGVRIGLCSEPVPVVAYADYVTVWLWLTSQLCKRPYNRLRGPTVPDLTRASPGLYPLDDGPPPTTSLVSHAVTTWGYWGTLRQTVSASWTQLVVLVELQAKDSYPRNLCLAHRILYARLLTSTVMVRGSGPPRTSTGHTTDHCSRHIFYMTRGHVQISHLHLTISPYGRWFGIAGHCVHV